MHSVTVKVDDSLSSLLEFAADNDVDGFRRCLDRNPSALNEVGHWYGRSKGSNRIVLDQRTPLMVSSTYGSLDVLELILSLASIDINRGSGSDNTTALHCAASGGSSTSVAIVQALLAAGADPTVVDADGNRPADVIAVPPKSSDTRNSLEQLLGKNTIASSCGNHNDIPLRVKITSSNSLPADEGDSTSPQVKYPDLPPLIVPTKKEYPVDPTLPDIKNNIYATDEFRMFSFKIRPCSRAYSHDWTECPFVHPGENARRRDPRKYHYSCVPCPDFRKGSCRRGDLCEYAHGVFECWLHPMQYRTRLCKDGTNCSRQVCFFAHTIEELRPLHMSTGSVDRSPRASSSAAIEMAAAMGFVPRSPSAVFTPPISPSANDTGHSLVWPESNMPTLNLPASNGQSSRLRSSLNARDIPVDDSLLSEFGSLQPLSDMHYYRLNSTAVAGNSSGRNKSLIPANLDDIFSAEVSLSPRCNSDHGGIFSPSNKNAMLSQFHNLQQQQSLLSPINTSVYSPKAMESQQLFAHSPLLQASLNVSTPGVMSPRSMEPISPLGSHRSVLSLRERQQQTLRSLSSRDLGPVSSMVIGSPANSSLTSWASPSGIPDWRLSGEELGHLKRTSSFELRGNADELDVSWVHSLVQESPPPAPASPGSSHLPGSDGENSFR
ncbi:zinc finger CCCH domain-containing protein 24-like [Curcuma longa]|uniref:zinc finger CCCH domain-containing protein 24-like n=1 Tax=Curcuma longa TaxID=136217 RepID=UPI003D9F800F